MGPNSGGGRKNAGPANVATRARFSTWTPSVKGKGGGGGGGGADRVSKNSKKQIDITKLGGAKSKIASGISSASGKVRSSSAGLPPWIDINAIETLSVSRELLAKLFRYMNFDGKTESKTANSERKDVVKCSPGLSTSTKLNFTTSSKPSSAKEVLVDDDGDVESSQIRELEMKIMKLKLSKGQKANDNSAQVASTSSLPPKMDHQKKIADYFQSIGFSYDEIFTVESALHSAENIDKNSFFLYLLANISNQSVVRADNRHSAAREKELILKAERNTDLTDECDVLKSIYGAAASSQMISILGSVCSITTLSLTEADLNIPMSSRCADGEGDKPALNIQFVVYNADSYPGPGSLALGWASSPFGAIDKSACRKCSIDAMNNIHSLLRGQACAFDFIQCISSSISSHIDSIAKNILLEQEARQVEEYYNRANRNSAAELNARKNAIDKQNSFLQDDNIKKQQNESSKSKQKASTSISTSTSTSKQSGVSLSDLAIPTPPIIPKAPVMPVKKWTEIPEYRTAYLEALNQGLSGQTARDHAKLLLTYVLAESTMQAIIREENSIEDFKNQSYSIEKLGTGGEIACTKQLLISTGLSKPKVKALLMAAKNKMVEEGKAAARDEEAMKAKWISQCLKLHRGQLERIEEKNVLLKAKKDLHDRKYDNGDGGGDGDDSEDGSGEDGEDGDRGSGDDNGSPVTGTLRNSEKDKEKDKEKEKEGEKKFSGGFSLEQCVAAVRLKAREREEAAQHRIPPAVEGTREDDVQKQRKKQSNDLENRRLMNDLEAKRNNKKYQDLLDVRSSLPAFQMREHIVKTILNNRVVVVSGDTGCGKTTQIPQLVFDAAIDMGAGADINLVVTQPRRISAISVAERIAQERVETVGQTAGYHIKLECKKSAKTRMLLMTTGVLLRRLQMEGDLHGISHVFVDEVHERDINTDFLLIVLKNLLKKRKDLKVILMSATLNAELFSNYFKNEGCALISIPGRAFPVTTYFLEDALEHTSYKLDPRSDSFFKGGGKSDDRDPNAKKKAESTRVLRLQQLRRTLTGKYSENTFCTMENLDEAVVNKELILSLVAKILRDKKPGAILIFVPGLANIRDITDLIKKSREIASTGVSLEDLRVLPLHSTLSSSEQSRVFTIYPPGIRKIVVSTNIAETSVTIPDVVFVLDTSKVKENRYDETSQLSVLDECWVSQANARQRSGRAGRVQAGICYRLISSVGFNELTPHTVPEMLRLSLEELILQILALDLGDPYDFLEAAISPPESLSIRNALKFLDNLSAVVLDNDNDDEVSDLAPSGSSKRPDTEPQERLVSQITPLGFHLAALPINPRIGKLILFGVLMGCVDPMLTIAATVSAKSPFLVPFDDRERADQAKLKFAEGDSDLLTMLNAYEAWKQICPSSSNGNNRNGGGGGYQKRNPNEEFFCRDNFLSLNALQMIEQMRSQFLDLLKDIGFLPSEVNTSNVAGRYENRNGGDRGMLGAVLCAGLAPNILQIPYSSRAIVSGSMAKKIAEVGLNSRKGPVYVHPSSVMSDRKCTNSAYMVYLEAMKTSKVYARDVTLVSPIALALFGGRLKIFDRHCVVAVEGWIAFKATSDLSKLLVSVRQSVEQAFVEKVLDPQGASSAEWQRAIEMLEALVLEGPPSDMVYVPPVLTMDYHSIPEGPRTQNQNQNGSHQGKAPQGNMPKGGGSSELDRGQDMPPRPPADTLGLSPQGGNGSTSSQSQIQSGRGGSVRTLDPDSMTSNDPHRDQQGGGGGGRGRGRGRGNPPQQQQQQNGEKLVTSDSSGRGEMGRGRGSGRGRGQR